jgi:hypothetical protein
MDPFARKMILGSITFGIIMACMAAALSVVYFHARPRCSEQALAEATAPNGQWQAAALQRRCGEDSPFFVHVNVRPAAAPIRLGYFSGRATEGEVFVAEQDAPEVVPNLEWTGPSALTIHCSGCRASDVRKRDDHIGAITINYELGH